MTASGVHGVLGGRGIGQKGKRTHGHGLPESGGGRGYRGTKQ